MTTGKPHFFESPAAMRSWLEKHNASATELLFGFHKAHVVKAGKRSLAWPASVKEALCFGWIDGVRNSVDDDRCTIRFTPRRSASKRGAVNIRLIAELDAAGRMTDEGREAFRTRKDPTAAGYKAQKKVGTFDTSCLALFRKHTSAWAFFEAQPPGYQRQLAWWVMQAKQEATRTRRLERLIQCSAGHRRLV